MFYRSLNAYLRETFGCKVYKLVLSAGCTCPNRDGTIGTRGCICCSGSGELAASASLSIPEQLAQAKRLVAAKAGPDARYIAYFQDFTNTYAPAEVLRPLFAAAIRQPEVCALSIATRPDCLPPEILSLLAELRAEKPVWVELGLQTIHASTAASITCLARIAVVTAPTPPGTGVMALTTGSAASESTSPTSLPAASSQLMPTSMIVWPSRTASTPIVRARPTAATTMSAARHSAARSRVCVWHVVTVALRAVSMAATGRPITSERPTTATLAPSSSTP